MGTFAAILGGIGGLSAVMGIVTALEVVDKIMPELTWMFWFVLAAILLLSAIALQSGHGAGRD
jgi:predicted lysophospholipase L1 biosynthesis ABC-type transport system permease subunit